MASIQSRPLVYADEDGKRTVCLTATPKWRRFPASLAPVKGCARVQFAQRPLQANCRRCGRLRAATRQFTNELKGSWVTIRVSSGAVNLRTFGVQVRVCKFNGLIHYPNFNPFAFTKCDFVFAQAETFHARLFPDLTPICNFENTKILLLVANDKAIMIE